MRYVVNRSLNNRPIQIALGSRIVEIRHDAITELEDVDGALESLVEGGILIQMPALPVVNKEVQVKEAQVEEVQVEEVQAEEAKVEEVQAEEVQAEEVKPKRRPRRSRSRKAID